MTFLWPVMLVSLLVVPLAVGFYLLLLRRRARIAASYATFMGGSAQTLIPGRLRHIPVVLFLLSLTLLALALARPQMTVNLPRVEGTVILIFDVSGSMAAEDVSPSRMAAAKVSASEFVQRQPSGVRIGVVAFSEGGLSVQTPTNEQAAVLAAIERLDPQTGTSLGFGIQSALHTLTAEDDTSPASDTKPAPVPQAAGRQGSVLFVLLSDGENTAPPDPFEAAFLAAEQGVRIYSIGIGSPAGTTLEVNGYTVFTQLNETVLEQIAGLTGGEYFNAASAEDFETIYAEISPELVIRPEKMEVTAILAGASLIFLLLGGGLMLAWFGRLP
jgi:Ca-activated chloride channel homolog